MKIFLLNLVAIFWCFATGAIIALGVVYSPWYLFFIPLPASFGWIPFAGISRKIENEKQFELCSVVVVIDFLLSIFAALICAKFLQGDLFLEILLYVGLSLTVISSTILMIKFRNHWFDKV